MGAGLTPDEDAELRRLHFFRRFGEVAARVARRYDELRDRDRRDEVREPDAATITVTRSADTR